MWSGMGLWGEGMQAPDQLRAERVALCKGSEAQGNTGTRYTLEQ